MRASIKVLWCFNNPARTYVYRYQYFHSRLFKLDSTQNLSQILSSISGNHTQIILITHLHSNENQKEKENERKKYVI